MWYSDDTRKKELIKLYFNIENPPIIPGDGYKEVLDILSIPYLHTVLLGPFNTLSTTFLKIFGELVQFWVNKQRMRGSGLGGDFNGPTIKRIIHNETLLEH